MVFTLLGRLSDIETIAIGSKIRDLLRLRKQYGKGRWLKRKGFGNVRLVNGTIHVAELHWYEAAGIGKKEMKVKRLAD